LTKDFDGARAVDDVCIDIADGEFVTLLGPSGCGKTTTLRMIAGFETPTSGSILLRDANITALPPRKRGIGMVFQNYALFPHLNVFENVAFGLKTMGLGRSDVATRVADALGRVDLSGFEKRKVQELSGGQQQRVALARAIAPQPQLILLDEPLSNLDAALRARTRVELRALLKREGITSVFVTHDQEEAFALSDRIAIMSGGHIQQVGTPESLYATPANSFVAGFVGNANLTKARVTNVQGERVSCELPGGAHWIATAAAGTSFRVDSRVRVMTRPEFLQLVTRVEDLVPGDVGGVVADRRFAGAHTFYEVNLAEGSVTIVAGPRAARVGDTVHVRLSEPLRAFAYPEAEE
ncbi:MAG TPA: ABC transporter ATP-binding protein, partial [Longimicrobiales bacterium]|nr:ABC transporter ATP-binding protein [Longimicrobiales bacterium]